MRTQMSRWSLLLVLLACVWGVSAVAASPAPAPAPQTHSVTIKGFAYHPATLTVKVGDTVVWKNEDMVAHTVTAANKSFDSGKISAGATWKLVVKKAGTFPYICTYHPNMHGTLIVQ